MPIWWAIPELIGGAAGLADWMLGLFGVDRSNWLRRGLDVLDELSIMNTIAESLVPSQTTTDQGTLEHIAGMILPWVAPAGIAKGAGKLGAKAATQLAIKEGVAKHQIPLFISQMAAPAITSALGIGGASGGEAISSMPGLTAMGAALGAGALGGVPGKSSANAAALPFIREALRMQSAMANWMERYPELYETALRDSRQAYQQRMALMEDLAEQMADEYSTAMARSGQWAKQLAELATQQGQRLSEQWGI